MQLSLGLHKRTCKRRLRMVKSKKANDFRYATKPTVCALTSGSDDPRPCPCECDSSAFCPINSHNSHPSLPLSLSLSLFLFAFLLHFNFPASFSPHLFEWPSYSNELPVFGSYQFTGNLTVCVCVGCLTRSTCCRHHTNMSIRNHLKRVVFRLFAIIFVKFNSKKKWAMFMRIKPCNVGRQSKANQIRLTFEQISRFWLALFAFKLTDLMVTFRTLTVDSFALDSAWFRRPVRFERMCFGARSNRSTWANWTNWTNWAAPVCFPDWRLNAVYFLIPSNDTKHTSSCDVCNGSFVYSSKFNRINTCFKLHSFLLFLLLIFCFWFVTRDRS
jgi:hypothetical protein